MDWTSGLQTLPAAAVGDLSHTEATEIMDSAFAHCKHLRSLRLPHKLRIVEQEAFLNRISLTEVSVPPTARSSINFKELANV